MSDRLVTAQCRTPDFLRIESTLREWPEVEAVGSFREKSNNKKDLTTVFVTFAGAEQAAAAAEKLKALEGLILEGEGKGEKKAPGKGPSPKRNKNLAAEVLKFDSYEERKLANESSRHPKRGRAGGNGARGRGGRGRGNAASGEAIGDNNTRQNTSRGGRGGRGGRAGGGQFQDRPEGRGRGRGRNNYNQMQRLPPIEANVAFADNIPFGTTNDRLMELFAPHGRVLDINRLELMAMVCYDNPESVQQCIQHVNGQKIGGNTITVSSGVVRIPGHIAMHLGM